MKNDQYWENRAAWNMYHYMEKAEQCASEIAEIYFRASRVLTTRAEDIFERYATKYGLSDVEARRLLDTMQDKTSVDDMLLALKNEKSEKKKQELLSRLEAPAYQARLERLKNLQNQIDSVMQEVYRQEKKISTDFYTSLASESYYRSMFDIQQKTGFGFSFSHISAKQIDKVLSMNWSGTHYSERIWKNTTELAQTLKEELIIDLLTGRTERETAQLINDRFGSGASDARRLVRTESSYVSGELNFQAYEKARIDRYIFLATLDLRTSKICQSLDGKVFLVKERCVGKNCNPMHPYCRSTTTSYISEEILELLKRNAYNPKTRQTERVPATMTYDEWYDKYVRGNPEAEAQEKIIRNQFSDRKQHERYRQVLGEKIPESFVKFQDMKYNNPEKWKFAKLDYRRQNELLENPEAKLPNAENAILPESKFTKYLLGGENQMGLAKGKAITDRLGYDINNWKGLQKEIKSGAPKYPAVHKGNTEYGSRYEQKMVVYGKKETPANMVVGWLHKPDGTTNMTSAYIKEVE